MKSTKRNKKSNINDEEVLIKNNIIEKIQNGEYKIAIFGLGHVGAPLAAVWLRRGAHVIGVDKSKSVLENALSGKTHIPETGVDEAFLAGINNKKFHIYDDLSKASKDSFLKMICVPVLARDEEADFMNIKEVAAKIGSGIKAGDLVTLNPSVPPGTTEEVIVPILEKESRGLKAERDFFMAYNPERIYEGRAIQDIEENYPAIIAGIGPKSITVADMIFSMIFSKGTIRLSNIRTAEMEKLLEGVYRDVNIALANELAIICKNLGIDFWEARKAANSQPFCNIHKPGTGVGGACIPVYPQFVMQVARKINAQYDITKISRIINNNMPSYCVREALNLIDNIDKKSKSTKAGIKITILGLAFRGGVSDTRLSPTYEVVKEFVSTGFTNIIVHDPYVKKDNEIQKYTKDGLNVYLTDNLKDAIKDTNLIFLSTDHPEYYSLSSNDLKTPVPVFDGRGILNRKDFGNSLLSIIGVGNI